VSERTPTATTTAPESTTGLAMILGEVKANLQHFIDETHGTVADLHAQVATEQSAREALTGEIATLKEIASEQLNVLNKLTAWMETLVTKQTSGKGTGDITTRDTATPPERQFKEQNREFHARLVSWARDAQKPAPPKPTGGVFPRSYDKQIAAWAEDVVSS